MELALDIRAFVLLDTLLELMTHLWFRIWVTICGTLVKFAPLKA